MCFGMMNDYDSYFEDTMRAGRYENRKESVDIMIRSSREVIADLVSYGVEFEQKDGEFAYTREGAHSRPRILYHADITGKEITSKLLKRARETGKHYDLRIYDNDRYSCGKWRFLPGSPWQSNMGRRANIHAAYTILASGGIGGCVSALHQFSAFDGRCIGNCKTAGNPFGSFGLCTDPPDNAVFQAPGTQIPHFRICAGRRCSALQ